MDHEIALVVEGMGCRRCVREVSRWLRDVPGVATVEADAATTRVRLTGTMRLGEVLDVFAGTAYTPRVGAVPGAGPDAATGR
ncbi:heavy-metal-associated domain-containing protein [Phycicoccus sp. M110.8]|uniref:heavy-metal-associated domain-containing protein n=1 Tax=Phycicoccus sp. M110.8 TaxID=3075433 RepID=UPI0028FD2D2A|nr:heavy-metal-associated domain-containing protein [Phycicoccus sp. M110.8]MDU0315290.1 heavy-metal-associated domain-containing protein [Phycicoccus sp. M110.8]HET8766730.1 heavy-metal-associated domain-containing protein [Pedococcus sp.]